MKFACSVKTIKGQPSFSTVVDTPNQGAAERRAKELCERCGLTPAGRVKAIKVKD